ncbi:MAG: hypothetical protein ACOVOX_16085 [Burkholderiaceae bacterium]
MVERSASIEATVNFEVPKKPRPNQARQQSDNDQDKEHTCHQLGLAMKMSRDAAR